MQQVTCHNFVNIIRRVIGFGQTFSLYDQIIDF